MGLPGGAVAAEAVTAFRAYSADYRCEACENRIEVSWVEMEAIPVLIPCDECKGRAHLLTLSVSSAASLEQLATAPRP